MRMLGLVPKSIASIRSLAQLPLALTAGGSILLAATEVPSARFCSEQDIRFAGDFDWYGCVVGLCCACFVFPLILPFLLQFRFWWLTRPVARWVWQAVGGATLVFLLFVIAPDLAARGWIPAGVGLLAYPGVDPAYLRCQSSSYESAGVLFGFLGELNTPTIAQMHFPVIAFCIMGALWSLLYLFTFLALRLLSHLRAR